MVELSSVIARDAVRLHLLDNANTTPDLGRDCVTTTSYFSRNEDTIGRLETKGILDGDQTTIFEFAGPGCNTRSPVVGEFKGELDAPCAPSQGKLDALGAPSRLCDVQSALADKTKRNSLTAQGTPRPVQFEAHCTPFWNKLEDILDEFRYTLDSPCFYNRSGLPQEANSNHTTTSGVTVQPTSSPVNSTPIAEQH